MSVSEDEIISLEIQEAVFRVLQELGLDVNKTEVFLDRPVLEPHGDYSTNVAMKFWDQFNQFRPRADQPMAKKNNEKLKGHGIDQIKVPKNLAEYIVGLLKEDEK